MYYCMTKHKTYIKPDSSDAGYLYHQVVLYVINRTNYTFSIQKIDQSYHFFIKLIIVSTYLKIYELETVFLMEYQ